MRTTAGRRSNKLWALAALVFAALALVPGSGSAKATSGRSVTARRTRVVNRADSAVARRLNVVFILSDDERVQGNAVMRDVARLLAAHGVTFSNFDVTTSQCGPSRASILTGQYSHHTGVTDNFGPHGYPAFRPDSDLAIWLHHAGYETALVGKYLNDYSLDGHGAVPPGWDDWQAMDSVPLEKYYDYKLDENGHIVHYGSWPTDYSTTVLTRRARVVPSLGEAAVLPLLRSGRPPPPRDPGAAGHRQARQAAPSARRR